MVMLNMDDELESEGFSWDDAYFELELGPHDKADEFEFRVSISAVVPFPAGFHPATTSIISANHHAAVDLTPTQITTTTTSTCSRKTVAGKMNRSMMMKLLVKLRSIISIRGRVSASLMRPFDRWFDQRRDEFQMVRRRRNLFGGRSPAAAAANSIVPSPLPQLGHHTSLLHAAIAHCNKSSFSFSL